MIPIDDVFRDLAAEDAPTADVPANPAAPARSGPPRRGRPRTGDYQGRFLVRVPASVHRELVERAARDHTTLNQLVLSYISRGLGADAGVPLHVGETGLARGGYPAQHVL
jgi:hypothetical protein